MFGWGGQVGNEEEGLVMLAASNVCTMSRKRKEKERRKHCDINHMGQFWLISFNESVGNAIGYIIDQFGFW